MLKIIVIIVILLSILKVNEHKLWVNDVERNIIAPAGISELSKDRYAYNGDMLRLKKIYQDDFDFFWYDVLLTDSEGAIDFNMRLYVPSPLLPERFIVINNRGKITVETISLAYELLKSM